MFIDEVVITVKSGKGGDGAATFHRDKNTQFGGPDGGDGGKGGDLVFVADNNINTLLDFKFKKIYAAQDGENGAKKRCFGKSGEDLIIRVPVGTMVRDEETGKLLLDLSNTGEERILFKGGRGGLGNETFKTSIRRTPKLAGKGKLGKELKVKLELKLLADVALVGYPSVGKSSFINKVSAAKSKVANYHFTTLAPKLGMVKLEEGKAFVIADIPGLIEGAHEGVGLGDKFLKHIERCKMIYHIVDVSGLEGRDPIEDYEKINNELKKFSEKLANKRQIVLANKMDLLYDMTNYEKFKSYLAEKGVEVYPISVLFNDGIKEILWKTLDYLGTIEREVLEEEESIRTIFNLHSPAKPDWVIEQDDEGTFVVEGKIIDNVLNTYVFSGEEGLDSFMYLLRKLGLEEELRKAGVENGDFIRIDDLEFEFVE